MLFILFKSSLYIDQKSQLSGEEQERKISTYEEAMSKIKDATGVSDIQVRFMSPCYQCIAMFHEPVLGMVYFEFLHMTLHST